MPSYTFTRRAHNASYSDRTAKVGKLKGTLLNALVKAYALCRTEGKTTVKDEADQVPVMEVSRFRIGTATSEVWVQIQVREDQMPNLLMLLAATASQTQE